jgi:alpha-beta hydrolase superfamily lysophospholipase
MRSQYSLKLKSGEIRKGFVWNLEGKEIPKGVLVIVSGMEEPCVRYDELAKFLNTKGFVVYSIDHIGQGENCEKVEQQGIWPDNAYMKNVNAQFELVQNVRILGKPIILLGHSMGSFMVQTYIQLYSDSVDKVILSGTNGPNPLFKVGYPLAKLLVRKSNRDKKAKTLHTLAIGSYTKSIKDYKTESDWISFNQDNVDKYVKDPRCGYGSSNGFYLEFLRGLYHLYHKRNLKNIRKNLPILIIAGEQDVVGNYGKGPRKLKELYQNKLHIKETELILYKDMRHEVLNETDRIQVFNDIFGFIIVKF